MTRRLEPLARIRELGDASVPFEFDVHAMIFSDDAPGLEKQLHRHFLRQQINKVNPRKEFFRLELAEIRQELETLGVETHWTMSALVHEFSETLRIEQQIRGQAGDHSGMDASPNRGGRSGGSGRGRGSAELEVADQTTGDRPTLACST